jgi:ribosome-associated heat shock protein Hsp15
MSGSFAIGGRNGRDLGVDENAAFVRADKWLWAVRLTKTRADAAAACRSGHVKINAKAAKPSSKVMVGDHIEAHLGSRTRIVDVVNLIARRVGAEPAAECYVDHSPPPPDVADGDPLNAPVFERERGAGRPTKRDRRQLDKLRGRPRR